MLKSKITKNAIYRQGDVLIQKIDRLPGDVREVEWDDRVILAYGEVTGHAHALSTAEAKMYSWQGERILEVKPNAKLVHEEHATIVLPAGFYKVIQQREYVPEAPPRDVID